jgi:hypothetical protein
MDGSAMSLLLLRARKRRWIVRDRIPGNDQDRSASRSTNPALALDFQDRWRLSTSMHIPRELPQTESFEEKSKHVLYYGTSFFIRRFFLCIDHKELDRHLIERALGDCHADWSEKKSQQKIAHGAAASIGYFFDPFRIGP